MCTAGDNMQRAAEGTQSLWGSKGWRQVCSCRRHSLRPTHLPLVWLQKGCWGRGEAPEIYSYRRSQASSAGPRHPPEALPRWGLCFLHFFWEPRFRRSQWGYFFLEGLNFEFCVDLKVSRSQVLRRRFAEATVIPTLGSSEPEWSHSW